MMTLHDVVARIGRGGEPWAVLAEYYASRPTDKLIAERRRYQNHRELYSDLPKVLVNSARHVELIDAELLRRGEVVAV